MITSDMSLWQFSKALYHSVGVEECCIELQDSYGADVNMLLLCCWCGLRGCDLDQAWFRVMLVDPQLVDWREQCIEPLRRLRRQLKTRTLPGTKELRGKIKKLELEAEKLEQDFLLLHLPGPAAAGFDVNLAWQNLKAYWLVLQQQDPELVTFAPMLRAMYPGFSEAELLALTEV